MDMANYEPTSELIEALSQIACNLPCAPLEPPCLSLESIPELQAEYSLGLCVVAPCGVSAAGGLDFAQDCNWKHPFRLVRVAARLPVDETPFATSDSWKARLDCVICNISSTVILSVPSTLASATCTAFKLQSVVRPSDDPRYGRCVLIEIPVPAGITLRPEAAITLSMSICGSHTRITIPATGHIHSGTCNHKQEGDGALWSASNDGDAAAVKAALAAGCSTEEADKVRGTGTYAFPVYNVFFAIIGRQHRTHDCVLRW